MDPQEFTVKQPSAFDLVGTRIGHGYLITGLLGTGGMGNVFRATQETIGRDVAIKFLPVEIASDATAVQRLGREAKALGQLNHPGIVTTFDFGFTERQEPYLVLELVDGLSLQAIIEKEKRIEMTRALPLFVQICEAMSYAHNHGIIHRDLKPLNIMIGRRDDVEFIKILDFGIVKLTSEVQQLTKSGEIWGSPFYMSPEQCTGGIVDQRSDIYSLGVVMYRALTGTIPHRGASFPETIARKLSEYPPAFGTVAPGLNLPEKLEAVVLKCLQKNSDERYPSMQVLRSELLKLFSRQDSEITVPYEPEVTLAKPAPILDPKLPDPRPVSERQTRNQVITIVAIVATLLGLGAAYAFWQKDGTTSGATAVDKTESAVQPLPTILEPHTMPRLITPTTMPTYTVRVGSGEQMQIIENAKAILAKKAKHPKSKPLSSPKPAARPNLQSLLRNTERNVINQIRPFRHSSVSDPNGFYRDFGGR